MKHFPELDLVILRLIEAHSDAGRFVDFSSVKGHSADQIGYQIGLLSERELIKAVDTRTDDEPNDWSAVGLTHLGHEHLKAIGASSSDGVAQEENVSENSSDSDNSDLVDQKVNYFRRHPIWSIMIFVFVVSMAVLVFWKNLTGETLGQSVMRLNLLPHETLEDCLAKAGDNFVEANKCHQRYPP